MSDINVQQFLQDKINELLALAKKTEDSHSSGLVSYVDDYNVLHELLMKEIFNSRLDAKDKIINEYREETRKLSAVLESKETDLSEFIAARNHQVKEICETVKKYREDVLSSVRGVHSFLQEIHKELQQINIDLAHLHRRIPATQVSKENLKSYSILQMPLSEAFSNVKMVNALKAEGINSLDQLYSMTKKEIAKVPNIGMYRINIIKDFFESHDLTWR